MPRYDRTGPMGAGPGTGLGRGKCLQRNTSSRIAVSDASTEMVPGGRPSGNTRGRCFGLRGLWQNLWAPPLNPSNEVEDLKTALTAAKEQIAAMEARLAELEKNG